MKCKRCRRAEAAVDLPSHHAAFCPDCFFLFFRRQVTEGIRKLRLLAPEDRVLVCVSGGKDSLVLWDVLMDEGYETEGLYIDLGIDGYSDRSKEKVLAYAASRGKTPIVVELAKEGIPIPEAARCVRMQECSICGTVKRYFFNRVAAEGKFTVVATGHNLDDETARLLGNLLHWQRDHLARQHPLLPGADGGLVRKVKPLWRVSEVETAAYGFLKGIDYVTEECPMSEDATSLVYKEALSRIEDRMPGTRIVFYKGFLDPSNPLRKGPEGEAAPCRRCAGGNRAEETAEGEGTPRACVVRRPDVRGDVFLLPDEGARAESALAARGEGFPMTEGKRVRRGPFRAGEDILLISPKGEEHLVTLTPGKAFGTHKGNLPHDDLIGKEDGGRAWTAMGSEYRAFRPTYMQFIMNQKRHAQIIYPKDTGTILMWADIFPGATVIEAGIGWGALTIKLLEAVGPTGKVVSYEIREDFAESGAGTVRRYLGACGNHEVKVRDIYLGIDEREVDRIVLDLPEPWQAVPHAREALAPGGIVLSYLPSTIQVKQLCDRYAEEGGFAEPETFEVILRPWHVKGNSVRPVQWMFSHSAFLVVTRKITT